MSDRIKSLLPKLVEGVLLLTLFALRSASLADQKEDHDPDKEIYLEERS